MTRRSWRSFLAPAAFLLAATVVALILHRSLQHGHTATTPVVASKKAPAATKSRLYIVRAGDTLASIAGKTGVGTARLMRLNPKLQPTSLFIGERIRLR